jgi:membrane-bound lytic murein transglycosylase D
VNLFGAATETVFRLKIYAKIKIQPKGLLRLRQPIGIIIELRGECMKSVFDRKFTVKGLVISGVYGLLLGGCMHAPQTRSDQQVSPGYSPQNQVGPGGTYGVRVEDTAESIPPEIQAAVEMAKQSTTPIRVTDTATPIRKGGHSRADIFYVTEYGEPLVKKWETYFLGRGRRHMDRYLDRLPRYEALMKGILKEEGVPQELIYIALIESGFNSVAKSHASAVGYWQFIRGTGKAYGLKQNWLVDERRDPIMSTRAAAGYFKALYQAFGSWHLAMSSYNAGEHRVLRAIMGNMTREFWELHEKKQLPRETLDYVPKFIAAAKIASNPKKYGFSHIEGQLPFSFEEIKTTKGISLRKFAQNTGVPLEEIKRLNPIFKTDYAPIYRGATTTLRIPVGKRSMALAALTKSYSTKKFVASSGRSYHRVRRGDNLSVIAKRYNTSVGTLKRLNGLSNRSIIMPGRKIKLPGSVVAATSRRKKIRKTTNKLLSGKSYRVRSGDNLWTISKRFGVSVRNMKKWNNLYSSKIKIGQVLKVNKEGGSTTRSPASYYVRRGDNLTTIARKHSVALSKLMSLNGLTRRSKIMVGKKLQIPR